MFALTFARIKVHFFQPTLFIFACVSLIKCSSVGINGYINTSLKFESVVPSRSKSETSKMVQISGKYELVSNENFVEFLLALGTARTASLKLIKTLTYEFHPALKVSRKNRQKRSTASDR